MICLIRFWRRGASDTVVVPYQLPAESRNRPAIGRATVDASGEAVEHGLLPGSPILKMAPQSKAPPQSEKYSALVRFRSITLISRVCCTTLRAVHCFTLRAHEYPQKSLRSRRLEQSWREVLDCFIPAD